MSGVTEILVFFLKISGYRKSVRWVQAVWNCFSGSWLAEGNTLVSSSLGSSQWRFLPDRGADPRVCARGGEVLMLRQCLHLMVQSADHTVPRRARWGPRGACFCNGAVRTVSSVQIRSVSGTLKGQTWGPRGDKDADRLPSQAPALRRMVARPHPLRLFKGVS